MVPQGQPPSNDPPQQTQHIVCGAAQAHADPQVAGALDLLLRTPVSTWADLGLEPGTGEGWSSPSWRGRLGNAEAAIELFREDTLAARASAVVRGSRAQRRYDLLVEARNLGLPVVAALAHGTLAAGGERASFLAWQMPPAAQAWSWTSPPAVLRQLGSQLRRCMDLGLRMADLRPDDLGVDGQGQAFWARIRALQRSGIACSRTRAACLAGFCGALDGGPLDPAAAAMLQGYEHGSLALPPSWQQDLALASRRWRRAALLGSGRSCFGPGHLVAGTSRRRGQPRWLWRRDADQPPTEQWSDPAVRQHWETWLQQPPSPQKYGRRGAVWLQETLVTKQRDAAAARHLWQAMHWLQFAGVATPAPQAICWHRGKGYVFAPRLANDTLAVELSAGKLGPADLVKVAASLGAEVGRMHAHGLRNRDLKFENLIRNPGDGRMHQVDLDGVRRKANLDTRGIGNDLGRLLAAFVAAGNPGGTGMLQVFLRAWLRSHRKLLLRPPVARILQQAGRRAAEWQAAHSR